MNTGLDTRSAWLALVLAASLVSGAAQTRADAGDGRATAGESVRYADPSSTEVAEAERYASEAYDAYMRRDYPNAVSLYLQALKASPSAGVLYNLARIYDTKLRDRELASNFYRRYIMDPGADPEHLRIANERLTALKELDAQTLASPPLAPARQRPAPASEPERERRITGPQIAGIVTGALGLAGLGVGIAYGVSAKSDADVAKGLCDGDDCRSQRGVQAAHDASDAATISTVCFAVGGAMTAVGTALLVFGRRDRRRADTASLRLSPYAGASTRALGVGFTGRW